MSYLSNDTGRPKEEGGHKRTNISVDLPTRTLLERVENQSDFIEYCVKTHVQPRCTSYIEPKESVSTRSDHFVVGAVFELEPYLKSSNAVLGFDCYFDRCCDDGGVEFRVTVNGKCGLTLVEYPSGMDFGCSHVYREEDLGFFNIEKEFRNQGLYIFRFEFKTTSFLEQCKAFVRDIHLFVRVIENPSLCDSGFASLIDGII